MKGEKEIKDYEKDEYEDDTVIDLSGNWMQMQ